MNSNFFLFSEVNKNRLKWAISVHFYLVFLMLTKLSSDVLDKLDIFVLELEELFVPKVCFIEQLAYLHLLSNTFHSNIFYGICKIPSPFFSAVILGVAVASLSSSHFLWPFCHQGPESSGCQEVPHWDNGK